MALLWFDGFESYSQGSDLNKASYFFNSSATPADMLNSSGEARTGLKCLRGTWNDWLWRSFGLLYTEVRILGFAVKFSNWYLADFWRAVNSTTTVLSLTYEASGQISIRRGSTTLGTTTAVLATNTWYYLEFKFTLEDSCSIDCILKINGSTEITLAAGTDTRNGTSLAEIPEMMGFTFNGSSRYAYFDDLYLCDSTGSVNNDFLGPVSIETLKPNGNGTTSDWDGSDGNQVNNYLQVDEDEIGGSDYIEAQNINEVDLFTYEDASASVATLHGVKVVSYLEKTTTAPNTIAHVCRSNSTNYTSDDLAVPEGDSTVFSIWDTDPDTSSAWTPSTFNSAEFGVKATT